MKVLSVTGPVALTGTVRVRGAKNSVLKLMAASLLAVGETVITNVPEILDVRIMCELLRRLGCGIEYDAEAGRVAIDVPPAPGIQADYELVRAMRASISVLGPLTGRLHAAHVAIPGGDAIGSRGLDMHAAGLEAMGATVRNDHGYFIAEAPAGLHGADIALEFPSVGATENLLMAATLATGTTRITNAAKEPEIVDITRMLQDMGAQIEGVGTGDLVVHGVDSLQPVAHQVVGDRIVAGTWAYGAAITGGEITIEGVSPELLPMALDKLSEAGAQITPVGEGDRAGFHVQGPHRPQAVRVATFPFPGFPTDLQPFAIALNALAHGAGSLTENLFESRWRFVDELSRLGADVAVDGSHALIVGVERLQGAQVEATDIRAGAGLVLAGLAAEGTTEVSGVEHIERGYENFVATLRSLGADARIVDRDLDLDLV